MFVPASGSSGSAGTAYRLDSQDSVDDPSNSWAAIRQTSISLREWDIPYEELNIGEKIGSGRFSTGKIDLGEEYSLLFSIAPKTPQSCSRMFFAFLAFEPQHQQSRAGYYTYSERAQSYFKNFFLRIFKIKCLVLMNEIVL